MTDFKVLHVVGTYDQSTETAKVQHHDLFRVQKTPRAYVRGEQCMMPVRPATKL